MVDFVDGPEMQKNGETCLMGGSPGLVGKLWEETRVLKVASLNPSTGYKDNYIFKF